MGKKNRLKQLLGRFNKETNCEIKALPYSFNGITREILVKVNLDCDNSLSLANVPYFLSEGLLREFFSTVFGVKDTKVELTATTASHADINKGYRSGHLSFATTQARRRAFDSIDSCKPFDLEKLNIKLPAWHKPLSARIKRLGKRTHSESEGSTDISNVTENERVNSMNTKEEVNGWTLVSKRHKLSFRGRINKVADEKA